VEHPQEMIGQETGAPGNLPQIERLGVALVDKLPGARQAFVDIGL